MHTTENSIDQFLSCQTPDAWVKRALSNIPTLLIDHAHCEKKAASAALHLIYKYGQYEALSMQLSKLAREELHHFEMVLKLLKKRHIKFIALKSCRYADGLRSHIRKENNNEYLVDILIVNAIIEARSCERFARIAPYLDETLNQFYTKLYQSEERHFLTYLEFAQQYSPVDIAPRIDLFLHTEKILIESIDPVFRFHSGI